MVHFFSFFSSFPIVSDCGKYLIISSGLGCTGNGIHISDLSRVNYKIENKLELIPIVPEEDFDFQVHNCFVLHPILEVFEGNSKFG